MVAFFNQHGIVFTDKFTSTLELTPQPPGWLKLSHQRTAPSRKTLVDAGGK